MSTTSSVGADRTPRVDTMMEKVALFCWYKFVHLGNKTHRKINLWPGRVPAGMWTQPFKAERPGRQ